MLVNPLVTVIVPNYNHARFLNQRLDSIFNQTYNNFEVILLDDLSQDNSIEVLDSYKDSRIIHRIYNKKNNGSPFKQWKKGLKLAKGDLVWIAESDDWADVTFLEKMIPIFSENENVAVAYSDMYYVDEHGIEIVDTFEEYAEQSHPTLWKNNHYYKGIDYVKDFMLNKCLIVNASSVVFKKDLGKKHIDRILNYKKAGDWLFWNILLSEEDVYVYFRGNEKLNYFRYSVQSTRSYPTIENKENGLIERTNVIFSTLNMLGLEQEKLQIKKREMLDWWAKDHSVIESLRIGFKSILDTAMFQETNVYSLYRHYIKYRIKNIPLIKTLRKNNYVQPNSLKN